MHAKGVVHRDLKLENVLLNNLGRIKLCDFGVSTCLRTDSDGNPKNLMDCCGTPAYMAPEVIEVGEQRKKLNQQIKDGVKKKNQIKIHGYTQECDIWSAGVLLYTMIYGTMPFRGITVREIKEKILAGKYILKDSVSKEARDLIKGMLQQDPEDRPTIQEILEDPWFDDMPKQEDVTIFDQNERTMMIKEYLFTENPDKWEVCI